MFLVKQYFLVKTIAVFQLLDIISLIKGSMFKILNCMENCHCLIKTWTTNIQFAFFYHISFSFLKQTEKSKQQLLQSICNGINKKGHISINLGQVEDETTLNCMQ